MVERAEKLGIRAEDLGADKAYGSGEFLAWLLDRGVQPHIPVIDRRHQTKGRFTRDQFRYEPAENAYYCPSIMGGGRFGFDFAFAAEPLELTPHKIRLPTPRST